MHSVPIQSLPDETATAILAAVAAGECVELTDNGRPIADIVPRPIPSRWISGELILDLIDGRQADRSLRAELDAVLIATTDDIA